MKQLSKSLYAFLLLPVLMACNLPSSQKSSHEQLVVATDSTKAQWHCPMNCQCDTSYTAAGSCPVCGMDLVEVEPKSK